MWRFDGSDDHIDDASLPPVYLNQMFKVQSPFNVSLKCSQWSISDNYAVFLPKM